MKRPDGASRHIAARTKIWAAGVEASPLAKLLADASGAECDRAGRIKVLPDCSLPGHPEVFAVGDMMALDDLPGVAEVAMQSGIHAASTIKQAARHGERGASRSSTATWAAWPPSPGFRAIVELQGHPVSGFLGWLMWLVVHLTFMTGFKNRFSAAHQLGASASSAGAGPSARSPADRPLS